MSCLFQQSSHDDGIEPASNDSIQWGGRIHTLPLKPYCRTIQSSFRLELEAQLAEQSPVDVPPCWQYALVEMSSHLVGLGQLTAELAPIGQKELQNDASEAFSESWNRFLGLWLMVESRSRDDGAG